MEEAEHRHTSFSVTYEPMAFIRLGKKKKRNQLRFSRKRFVSAMQPGYIELKVMPVSTWNLSLGC